MRLYSRNLFGCYSCVVLNIFKRGFVVVVAVFTCLRGRICKGEALLHSYLFASLDEWSCNNQLNLRTESPVYCWAFSRDKEPDPARSSAVPIRVRITKALLQVLACVLRARVWNATATRHIHCKCLVTHNGTHCVMLIRNRRQSCCSVNQCREISKTDGRKLSKHATSDLLFFFFCLFVFDVAKPASEI